MNQSSTYSFVKFYPSEGIIFLDPINSENNLITIENNHPVNGIAYKVIYLYPY